MGNDELQGERIAVLEVKVAGLIEQHKARASREWGVIMAVFGLILTVLAKTMGLVP